jgi:hypothetical protein
MGYHRLVTVEAGNTRFNDFFMAAPSDKKPGFRFVRWIMVVTLGCSLGLLYVFTVVSTRQFVRSQDLTEIDIVGQPQELPFKLSEEHIGRELTSVIESQLAAFRKEDYPQAYTYAASFLRTHLPLPAFERMVRTQYPAIAHSTSVTFGPVLDNGDTAVVNVTVFGESEETHFQYLLEHEPGGWKIFSVAKVKAAGVMA